MKPVICAAVMLALAGCVYDVTPDQAPATPTAELCKTLAAYPAGNASRASYDAALAELRARQAFPPRDLDAIAAGQVRIGMTEAAGLCAVGNYWYDVNTTTTAAGTTRQYVLGDGQYVPRRYLYTRNGIVTAFQG